MGKEEHGGPFTANQVEKVKVYAKIFCILLTLGPIFAVDTVASVIPSIFATHMDDGLDNDDYIKWILSYYDLLTFILILLIIPFYICLVGPSVYIPGRLKRIGIGVVFIILSLTYMFLIDIIGHKKTPFSTICFISDNFNSWNNYEDTDYIYISSWFIVFSYIFNAFARIFLDVAMYEFICVTSPRDLIGLCFGTLYAIKGIFQLFAVVIVLLPFNSWSKEYSFPSCGLHTFLSIL